MYRLSPLSRAKPCRRLLSAISLVAAVSGCTLPLRPAPEAHGGAASSSGIQLDAALGAFLADAPVGAALALTDSPWGSNVEILVEDAYLSASGRECRKLKVLRAGAGGSSREVACQNAQGWGARRLITEVSTGGAQR